MEKFRFHIIGLPHTEVTKEYISCAYTQKILKFCNMMQTLGHEIYLYAGGGKTEALVNEFISCISKEDQQKYFGDNDWRTDFFKIDWDGNLPYWKDMNNKAIDEIKKRIQKKDFILLIGGVCQKDISDAFPEHIVVEMGVGYKGVFSKFKVFESYAWMHYVYGLQKFENGQNYDVVIPNYFEIDDFPFSDKKDDYFLFIGRLISRKGAHIAVEATGRLNEKLIMAGQGVIKRDGHKFSSKELEIDGEHVTHIGTVNELERGKLMSRAKAVFVQTQYIGPFEGVAVEAMLCGTPIITTDWGCFSDYNLDGVTGFRTRTFGEILYAMKNVDKLDYKQIRKYAIDNFSTDRVKYQYQAYFEQLYQLWDKGWYSEEYNFKNDRYQKYEPTIRPITT
jgi:glycosyltransferase involved in cell wall biosynthesis